MSQFLCNSLHHHVLSAVVVASATFYLGCEHTANSEQPVSQETDSTADSGNVDGTSDGAGDKGGENNSAGKEVGGEDSSENNDNAKREQEDAPQQDGDRPSGESRDQADAAGDAEHPFTHRAPAPEFPKDAQWINTGGPLRLRDLRGKFVLLDFWTYCCINCIHVLPELKKLERKYPNELVVIGVHSAKFETEKGTRNIEEAALRYEIEHPIVNDAQHRIWNMYRVNSWPSIRLIDPEGNLVAGDSGEFTFELLDGFLQSVMPYYRDKGLMDETPVRFDLLAYNQEPTPLRFPGKVLADAANDRLFISDSNHNRIVVCSLDGSRLIDVIGSGQIGFDDGDYATCSFDHPQGMALQDQTLYVADTENHAIRKIDLVNRNVKTIAGLGEQGRNAWPGLERLGPQDELPDRFVGHPEKTALNSPWALWVHGEDLYIAMAGPHQIWKMALDKPEIGPYAGNGREDIVDGPLLPDEPYAQGASSFAQPSGLASDGEWLYVADSEGSSIRAVPFDKTKDVKTIVGTSELPHGRLFAFGDADGTQALSKYASVDGGFSRELTGVLLQHALGVVYHDQQIFVADTYNNKIKVINAQTGETRTIAGTGEPGHDDDVGTFDEPAGITFANGKLYVADTNNHLIRVIDLESRKVSTLEIAGLQPPRKQKETKPSFVGAARVELDRAVIRPQDGSVILNVQLKLPDGWKVNPLAPMGYLLEAKEENGPIDRSQLSSSLTTLEKPAAEFEIRVPVTGTGKDVARVSLNYYYCQTGGEGLCKVGSVVWQVPLELSDQAGSSRVQLRHTIGQ